MLFMELNWWAGGCIGRNIPLQPSLATDIANVRYKCLLFTVITDHLRPPAIVSGCGLLNIVLQVDISNRWGKHRKFKLFFILESKYMLRFHMGHLGGSVG